MCWLSYAQWPRGDWPLLLARDGDGFRQVVDRCDPDVEHAVHRRQEADPFAVVAEPGLGLLRIAERACRAESSGMSLILPAALRGQLRIGRLSRGVGGPQAEQNHHDEEPETHFDKHGDGTPDHRNCSVKIGVRMWSGGRAGDQLGRPEYSSRPARSQSQHAMGADDPSWAAVCEYAGLG